MSRWTEVAEDVFTCRFEPIDIAVTAVVGAEGVLVVDTRCSVQEGEELRESLSVVTPLPVRWVVNTHEHFDHMWGNAAFDVPLQVPPAEFWGHENIPDYDPGDPDNTRMRDWLMSDDPGQWGPKLDSLVIRKPDHLVAASAAIDVGGRIVELRHLGRGHTDNDLVVWLPDSRVLVGGDMIEQAAPPAYGSDCFPLDWYGTLGALSALTGDGAVFVPGHGDAVDHAFVLDQREFVLAVERQIRELYASGVPVEKALEAGDWPHPERMRFTSAVRRGYAQLSGEIS